MAPTTSHLFPVKFTHSLKSVYSLYNYFFKFKFLFPQFKYFVAAVRLFLHQKLLIRSMKAAKFDCIKMSKKKTQTQISCIHWGAFRDAWRHGFIRGQLEVSCGNTSLSDVRLILMSGGGPPTVSRYFTASPISFCFTCFARETRSSGVF